MTEIVLSNTDRILVLGDSLSGKTYLVRKFSKQYKHVKVITPQHDEFKDYRDRVVTWDAEVAFEAIGEGLQKGNMLIIIDDADILLEKLVKDSRLKFFFSGARHRGVAWVIVSRRTQDIPTLAAKQANRLFLFQTDLPHDTKFLNEYYYPAGDEVRELDRNAHEFLYIDRDLKTRTRMTA